MLALLIPNAAPAAESDKPGDKALCADSYRNAQVQRKIGALKRARELLLVCLSDKCPSVLQPDCTRWLTEVEAALPSVTFAAKGVDGKDVTAVRVSMDGQVLTETLDGKAIPIDPGSHVLRFEYAGEVPIEQTIIAREGEKARVVSVSWTKTRALDDPTGASPTSRPSGGVPTSAWIFGGVGASAVATFGILALHGMQRRSDLEKECFGSCRQDQVDSIKSELAIADVALGVGVASLGVSAVLFLTSGKASSPEPSSSSASSRPRIVSFTSGKALSPEPSSSSASSRPRIVSFGVAPMKNGGAASIAARF